MSAAVNSPGAEAAASTSPNKDSTRRLGQIEKHIRTKYEKNKCHRKVDARFLFIQCSSGVVGDGGMRLLVAQTMASELLLLLGEERRKGGTRRLFQPSNFFIKKERDTIFVCPLPHPPTTIFVPQLASHFLYVPFLLLQQSSCVCFFWPVERASPKKKKKTMRRLLSAAPCRRDFSVYICLVHLNTDFFS